MVIELYPEESDDEFDFKQWTATFRCILLVSEILSQCYKIPERLTLDNGQPDYVYYGFPYGDYGGITKKFTQTKDSFALRVFEKYSA